MKSVSTTLLSLVVLVDSVPTDDDAVPSIADDDDDDEAVLLGIAQVPHPWKYELASIEA